MNIPYTYFLKNNITKEVYYGVRYSKDCSPEDFWKKYFTSSKKVKRLISLYGKDSFYFLIKKTFKNKEDAVTYEEKILHRLKVTTKNWWLNDNISGGMIRISPEKHTEMRTKQSETLKRKYATGDIVVWNKGKTGVQKSTRKGITPSQEIKNKMKGPRPNINKTHMKSKKSDEYKKKISETLKRKYASGEIVVWNKKKIQ